jgi:hypothetical protein
MIRLGERIWALGTDDAKAILTVLLKAHCGKALG